MLTCAGCTARLRVKWAWFGPGGAKFSHLSGQFCPEVAASAYVIRSLEIFMIVIVMIELCLCSLPFIVSCSHIGLQIIWCIVGGEPALLKHVSVLLILPILLRHYHQYASWIQFIVLIRRVFHVHYIITAHLIGTYDKWLF